MSAKFNKKKIYLLLKKSKELFWIIFESPKIIVLFVKADIKL